MQENSEHWVGRGGGEEVRHGHSMTPPYLTYNIIVFQ